MKIQYVKPSISVISADLCSILSVSGEKEHACSTYCKLWHICRDRGHGKVCMKLKKLMYDNLMFQGRLHREEIIDNFVEDFKKYMEG